MSKYSALVARAERLIRKASKAHSVMERMKLYGRACALVNKAKSLSIWEAIEKK